MLTLELIDTLGQVDVEVLRTEEQGLWHNVTIINFFSATAACIGMAPRLNAQKPAIKVSFWVSPKQGQMCIHVVVIKEKAMHSVLVRSMAVDIHDQLMVQGLNDAVARSGICCLLK